MPSISTKVYGDYATLDKWIRRFGELASGKAMLDVSRDMAKATLELIDQGFEKQQDPFGNPWKPKKEPDGRRILHGKTGKLRRWNVQFADMGGFKVASKAPYAGVHQNGSGIYAGGSRYKIEARNAPYLRFKVGGKWRKTPSVMHTGVPRRRMEPGSRLPTLWASIYRDIYVTTMRNYLRR